MVELPWDYKWSSTAFNACIKNSDALIKDRSLNQDDMKAILLKQSDNYDTLEEKTRTGRPCGDESFTSLTEKLTGTKLKIRKAGR
ncbi:MAG: hypothetical protein C0602_10710, partial [Denitrovibrio sp.]